jgi:FkbM family methyltransferase
MATVHGYRVRLELSEHIQRMIYLGAYERWETRTLRRHLQPGMCAVDVGANVGYFTLLAAARVGPTGQVVAVEPSPPAADRLESTVRENRISQVRLVRCGLGRAPGEVVLYDPLPDNHTPTMLGDPGAPGRAVPVRTLDELTNSLGLARIDLLKVDVEGYEPEVFAGAAGLLAAGRVRAVLCEFNEHWLTRAGTTGEAVYRDLIGYGFADRTGHPFVPGATLDNRFLVLPPGRTG